MSNKYRLQDGGASSSWECNIPQEQERVSVFKFKPH